MARAIKFRSRHPLIEKVREDKTIYWVKGKCKLKDCEDCKDVRDKPKEASK